jgi:hypothetical protein
MAQEGFDTHLDQFPVDAEGATDESGAPEALSGVTLTLLPRATTMVPPGAMAWTTALTVCAAVPATVSGVSLGATWVG